MERDGAAAEEEHRDQGLRGMEAEGATGDHSQTIVEAFDDAIGEAVADVGEDPVAVFADGAGEAHEGLEAGTRGPGQPLAQRALGSFWLAVIEDLGERLFEQIGSIERTVGALDQGFLSSAKRLCLRARFSRRSVRPRICSRRT